MNFSIMVRSRQAKFIRFNNNFLKGEEKLKCQWTHAQCQTHWMGKSPIESLWQIRCYISYHILYVKISSLDSNARMVNVLEVVIYKYKIREFKKAVCNLLDYACTVSWRCSQILSLPKPPFVWWTDPYIWRSHCTEAKQRPRLAVAGIIKERDVRFVWYYTTCIGLTVMLARVTWKCTWDGSVHCLKRLPFETGVFL